ncbi:MAG: DUF1080 domain-containing protein [Gemmatimonadota bacterium]|nr:DUF1080 domain-containing protein [Gemmatimonadota bacterium]
MKRERHGAERRRRLASILLAGLLTGLPAVVSAQETWTPLFNGRDLSGWVVKITGHDLGDDPFGTFRVEDGLLTVRYESYESFDGRFGHLFHETPYSDYRLRVEYRFVGEQVEGGPAWARRNSGVMFHSQAPATMTREQDFPISLELQFLGGNGEDVRPTANLCTPGTHVEIAGALVERHCVTAAAPTFQGDVWVTAELVARGDSVEHVIDGDVVLAYARPVIGGGEVNGHDARHKLDGRPLTGGYIALQSESHPIQFRQVLIRPLP